MENKDDFVKVPVESQEETEEDRREDAADREFEVPSMDQFAVVDKLLNLDGKLIDPEFFNKDFITGKLTLLDKLFIDETIETAQLCKLLDGDLAIKFLSVVRNAHLTTSKSVNGWFLETILATTVNKRVEKVDYNAKPQQQQNSPLQNLGGMLKRQ